MGTQEGLRTVAGVHGVLCMVQEASMWALEGSRVA